MRIGALVGFLQLGRAVPQPAPDPPVGNLHEPTALSGAAYAAATIGSEDIVNGSIRNRDFKDGTLRGNEAK
jgi:hypothetical protein